MGMLDFITDIPIVGDIGGALLGHASASELQEDTQAHSEAMFAKQAQHEKDMFGLESDYATAKASEQYHRQRMLLQDSPGLQIEGFKSAGLNPILAATGGFKSPAGGTLPIPTARATSSAKGGGAGIGSAHQVNIGQARLLNEQADLTEAQKAKTDAETRKIESEQPKRDFKEFFWEVFNGSIRRFDEAFEKWSQNNRKMLDDWMDKYGISWQSIKDDFKKYVTDAPPGRNPVSGGHGRKNRRNKK